MKKVGIITFHASHNYGSMLQAYALQQTILNMGYECEIINFRTLRQRNYYKPDFLRGNFKERIKRTILYAPFLWALWRKYQKFETFLNEMYRLSPCEYATLEELKNADLDYDIYVSGSDQIWNTLCLDFDWAYFLPFAGHSKRVAYAPSMGAIPEIAVGSDQIEKLKGLINRYDKLSVREQQTGECIRRWTSMDCDITLDPTLLISSEQWDKIAGDTPLVKGNYIYLYTPWFDESIYTAAERISKVLNMPIVVSLLHNGWRNNRRITQKPYECHLATGPIEFLNLCKFATLNIGKSFHLTVFSILLRTPFYAIDGMNDSRVRDLLVLSKLEALGGPHPDTVLPIIDFDEVNFRISQAKTQSMEWLHNAISSDKDFNRSEQI